MAFYFLSPPGQKWAALVPLINPMLPTAGGKG